MHGVPPSKRSMIPRLEQDDSARNPIDRRVIVALGSPHRFAIEGRLHTPDGNQADPA